MLSTWLVIGMCQKDVNVDRDRQTDKWMPLSVELIIQKFSLASKWEMGAE